MTIERWYRLQARQRKSQSDLPWEVRTWAGIGMRVNGPILQEGDGFTRLAEFIRHGQDPLVRLVLPNQLTIGRHRQIRDVILAEGGKVISVPGNTLDAADIERNTIDVIHTKPSKHAFRADEQLIKADVRVAIYEYKPYWGNSLVRVDRRPAYFLSGYDRNEKGLSYFFCELPPGVEPKTVGEAYEALKPESVKIAEKLGRKVKRQGDMFFIRMKDFGIGDLTPMTKARLHRSNHTAEEGVRVGGLLYVRGTIVHSPEGRPPDHAPLKLGRKHWWLCVRNTVPVSG